jgi:predicted DNA binding CopG/RHH family protein
MKGGGMENEKINDRLGAVMDEAQRIKADMAEEKAGQLKKKAIQINFNEAELDRLKNKADAQCLKLQDYIRKILTTYG